MGPSADYGVNIDIDRGLSIGFWGKVEGPPDSREAPGPKHGEPMPGLLDENHLGG